MKLSIRIKLMSSFIAILALLTGIGVLAIVQMGSLQKSSSILQTNWLPSLNNIGVIKDNFMEARVNINKINLESDPAGIANIEQTINESMDKAMKGLSDYEHLLISPEETEIFNSLRANMQAYSDMLPPIIQARIDNEPEKGYALVNELTPHRKKVTEDFSRWIAFNNAGVKAEVDSAAQTNKVGKSLIIGFGIFAIAVGVGLAFLISESMVRAIRSILNVATKAAKGDLREQAFTKSKDELGTLAAAFNDMMDNLRQLISHSVTSAQSVAAASEEISATTEEIAKGSTEQAESAQVISELVREMSIAVNDVANKASVVAELSDKTKRGAEDGSDTVSASVQSMENLSAQMQLLEKDSQKIGQIIEVIDEISEQTNLLALNAAIEAARAGDQGRGFAVVADEVRKLAERSSEATQQIAEIIKGMQHNTDQSLRAMEHATLQTSKTGQTFESIVRMVSETADQVTEIAAASEEQAAQSEEVMRAVETIAAASEESAAAAEETASSSQTLAHLSEELNKNINFFKV
ncbi:methyl-accepting chemotaxis protein [Paenibacillus sp. BC26]|uniref:methyl-accepting chemotaxis protein n=1 Tax=Paenibacillus sp. BC26 TaxID=1881032 RepID=UPI0008F3C92B|nr:methyl-accepting chemotaxis protein [Paenibacillus sp. BC26]SFT16706.1 methyl-accepting chemotaxis protein [Paenibacillus sp. BC26]